MERDALHYLIFIDCFQPDSVSGTGGMRALRPVGRHHVARDIQYRIRRYETRRHSPVCPAGAGRRCGMFPWAYSGRPGVRMAGRRSAGRHPGGDHFPGDASGGFDGKGKRRQSKSSQSRYRRGGLLGSAVR